MSDDVLRRFLEKSVLIDEDRKELKEKRGFDDDTIDEAQLRSVRRENEKVILELVQEFGQDKVLKAGLLNPGRPKDVDPIRKFYFREEGKTVIIPYFEKGKCVRLRPHKWFPKGSTLRPFFANEEYDSENETIITEGEFKALAAKQYNYQAIAVPGISSFLGDKLAGKKFTEFYEDLQIAGIGHVTFMFDNEDKSDKELPTYKEDPEKRYDTQYYSYLMAKKINDYGADIEASIAWIPDEYRDEKGKADIDGMLAKGVKEEIFDELIQDALDPEEFVDSLMEDVQYVINKKLSSRREKVNILERKGRYIYITSKQKADGTVEEFETEVSNFTLRYIATHVDEEKKRSYEFSIRNISQNQTILRFTGEEFSNKHKFRSATMSAGKYIWSGSGNALDALFNSIIPDEEKIITERTIVGWDEEVGVFIFDNCIIDEDGKVHEISDDGLIHYKDWNIHINESGDDLRFDTSVKNQDYTIEHLQEVGARLARNFGDAQVYLAISWFVACMYKPWLFSQHRIFPILFVFGRHGSGKTRLIQWLMEMYFDKRQNGIVFGDSTKASTRNKASKLPYFPLWIDEYRDNNEARGHMAMFRAIYDHIPMTIARRGARQGEVQSFPLKTSLVMSGEYIPTDETGALNERMITLKLPNQPAGGEYGWFEDPTRFRFSGIFRFLLKNRQKFVTQIRAEWDRILMGYRNRPDVDQRVALNYSLMHAVAKVMFNIDPENINVDRTFEEIRTEDQERNAVFDIVRVCLDGYANDKSGYSLKEAITVRPSTNPELNKRVVVAFCLVKCLRYYNEYRRRLNHPPIFVSQMRKMVNDTEWITYNTKPVRIKGSVNRVHEVDLGECPDETIILQAYTNADDDVKNALLAAYGGDQGPLASLSDHNSLEDYAH